MHFTKQFGKIFLISLFAFHFSFAQTDSSFKNNIDTLNTLCKIIQRGENDSLRNSANAIFSSRFENLLSKQNSFETNFDSLKTISAQIAPDNSFRLYTWVLPKYDGSAYSYFGFLQTQNKKTKQTTLYSLKDSTEEIEKPQSAKLKPDKWYGALYYKIVLSKKDKKNYYVLLGWHAKNVMLTQKIIDVISFDGAQPVFGAALFKAGNIYNRRIIFEFTSQSSMAVRYEERRNMIVFDHLSADKNMHGPDGTYDAYKFTNGHWELRKDVDVNTNFQPKTPKEKLLKDEELEELKK